MSIVKDFVGGTVSGISQVFVMQPFQIIKIRLANQSLMKPDYEGIFDCFTKILKNDGLLGFYRGTLSPLLGVGPQVALQFATNQFVKRALNTLNQRSHENHSLSLYEALTSGFITGVPSAFVVANGTYCGSLDAAKKIYSQKGISGIYMGLHSTLLRQMIALSVYFGTYQYWKNKYIKNSGESDLPLVASFTLGGVSGAASWLYTYPIDYVKTLIQSQNINSLAYKSSCDCALQKYKEEGLRTFFKGLGVTMLRSFPVNGIGFLIFQLSMRGMGREDYKYENN